MNTNGNPTEAIRQLLYKILSEKLADAVMVSARTPYSPIPMPILFSDPEMMDRIDPLAPASPFNSARQASSILRHETGKRIALVLRPCEIRALIELVKLNQCTLKNAILIGIECLGRMENDVFLKQTELHPNLTNAFYQEDSLKSMICQSCKICEHFQPQKADMTICLIGLSISESIGILAETDIGLQIMKHLGLSSSNEAEQHKIAVDELRQKRLTERDILFQKTSEKINTIEKLQNVIANCLNCYNCRTACPVCYCKVCVFLTDVFTHEPELLIKRSGKKGMIKLPPDTAMFHLTRLAHMSHSCVGCGHCSSVCPSHIPVADIFQTVAAQTQALYDYEPGRDLSEPIPMLIFGEHNHDGE